MVLHFVPALDPRPVGENLDDAFSRLERTNQEGFRNLEFGVCEPSLLRPQDYRVPKHPFLVRSSIEKAASKFSLTGRGSRAGTKCNTIEELRGALGDTCKKIIIFPTVSERG